MSSALHNKELVCIKINFELIAWTAEWGKSDVKTIA